MSKKDRLAAVDDKLREREGGEYDLANCIVDHCWSPHPAHLRCATLPLQGRVNTIVLAMRFQHPSYDTPLSMLKNSRQSAGGSAVQASFPHGLPGIGGTK